MFFMKFVQILMFCKTTCFVILEILQYALLNSCIIILYFFQVLFDLATRGNGDRHKLLCKEVKRNDHNHDWTSELHSAHDHQTSHEGDITRRVTSQSCVKSFNLWRLATCLVVLEIVLSKIAGDNLFQKQAWSLVSFSEEDGIEKLWPTVGMNSSLPKYSPFAHCSKSPA